MPFCDKKKSTFIKNQEINSVVSNDLKMNKIINKFLLSGDKFMAEFMPRFTCSACGPFTKHHERNQKFIETETLKYLYRNELDKACFMHNAAYSDSKDLAKAAISNNNLKDRAFEIARSRDAYQRALASMVYKLFVQKAGAAISVNMQLVEELHKSVINPKEEKSIRDSRTIFRQLI